MMSQIDKDITTARRKKYTTKYSNFKPIPDQRFIDFIKEKKDTATVFRCLVKFQAGEYKSWKACLKDIVRQDQTLEDLCYPKKKKMKKAG